VPCEKQGIVLRQRSNGSANNGAYTIEIVIHDVDPRVVQICRDRRDKPADH